MKKKIENNYYYFHLSSNTRTNKRLETIEEDIQENYLDEDWDEPKKNSWTHIACTIIVSFFQAAVLYILIHSKDWTESCGGENLWNWIMTRFLLFFLEIGFIIASTKSENFILLKMDDENSRIKAWVILLMMFAIHNVLFGVGLSIIWNNTGTNNEKCSHMISIPALLFNDITTKVILEIIGYLYMVFDIVYFLVCFFIFCFSLLSQNNYNNNHLNLYNLNSI